MILYRCLLVVGIIFPNKILHTYVLKHFFLVQVVARQVSGTGQASSTAEVRINLVDKNDNPPVFTQQVYQIDVFENITAGTPIISVSQRVWLVKRKPKENSFLHYTSNYPQTDISAHT